MPRAVLLSTAGYLSHAGSLRIRDDFARLQEIIQLIPRILLWMCYPAFRFTTSMEPVADWTMWTLRASLAPSTLWRSAVDLPLHWHILCLRLLLRSAVFLLICITTITSIRHFRITIIPTTLVILVELFCHITVAVRLEVLIR